MRHRNGSTHADDAVQTVIRGLRAHGVAADVAAHAKSHARKRIKHRSVRAPGAENGRPARYIDRLAKAARRGFLPVVRLAHRECPQLALVRKKLLAPAGYPEGLDIILDEGLQLLHHNDLAHVGGKFFDQLRGKRVRERQLQHRNVLKYVHHVLVADAGGDDARLSAAVRGVIHGVRNDARGNIRRRSLKPPLPLVHVFMALLGHGRHHAVFHDILGISLRGPDPLAKLDKAPLVRDPRGEAQYHRRVKFLADGKGQLREFEALPAVRGLQHRHVAALRVKPGVLLVLRAEHSRVVRHHEYDSTVYAGIRTGVKRIGRHVKAHVLHAAHGSCSRNSRSDGNLGGHLLVGSPFAIDLLRVVF